MNNLVPKLVPLLAAAGNLQQNLGQVAGVLNAIAILLFFGGLTGSLRLEWPLVVRLKNE